MCVGLAVEMSVSLLVLCCKLSPYLPLLIAWPERQQVPSQRGLCTTWPSGCAAPFNYSIEIHPPNLSFPLLSVGHYLSDKPVAPGQSH